MLLLVVGVQFSPSVTMDPSSSKAQEQHARMHADLLAKGKRIGALEAELAAAVARAHDAERRVQAEAKRSAQAMQDKDIQLAERVAELDEREESLADAQEAAREASAKAEAEMAQARTLVADAERRVAQVEEEKLALQRERDAQLAANATALQAHHEQLLSLSRNHLERQNDDIARLAKIKAAMEEQKTTITLALQEKLVDAERKHADLQARFDTELAALREQLRQTTARADEDAARHAQQRAELEATLASERTEMAEASHRVTESATEEITRLQEEVAGNARLAAALTAWEGRRAASEAAWQATKDENTALAKEVSAHRSRVEALEASHAQALLQMKRELDSVRQKLAESDAQLQKKSAALEVYHNEIKRNAARMAELAREKQQSERQHRAEQERAAQMVAAAQKSAGGQGKPNTPGLGDTIAGLFRSKEKDAAAGRGSTAAASTVSPYGAGSGGNEDLDLESPRLGPKRTLSAADGDEATVNQLHEEMAVALSKRVEALEDERLSLTAQLDALKKRAHSEAILNELLRAKLPKDSATDPSVRAALRAAGHADGSSSSSASAFSDGTSAAAAPKKSLLGGLLGGVGKKDPASSSLSDPAHLRALLEESVLSNQSLTIESERSAAEAKRLKAMLDAARQERDEAVAREKIMAAQAGVKKNRKSVAPGAAAAEAAGSGHSPSPSPSPSPQ